MAYQTGLRRQISPVSYAEDQRPKNELAKAVERGFRGFSPSIDRTQAAFQAAVGQEEAARANLEEAARYEAETANMNLAPAVGRVEDVYQPGDLGGTLRRAGQYGASVIGENLPLLGSMAVGGVGGAVAGRALGAGRALTKGAGYAGAATPYGATSVGEVAGDIMTPQATGTLQEQGQAALGYGLAKTGVGMLPFGAGAKMLRGPGGRLAKAGKVGGVSAATEGLTEVGEEAIGQFAETQYVPGSEMWSEEAQSDYLNALAGGAILGGATGAVAGGLAPQRLSRGAEDAMQSAFEEGRSPQEGMNQWLSNNIDVMNDDEVYNFTQSAAQFQPQAARSDLQRRMDRLAANDELELAFSEILGPENVQGEFGEQLRLRARELARSLASGKVSPNEPAIKGFAQAYPEEFKEAIGEQFAGSTTSQQISPEEQAQMDVEDPQVEFQVNAKGLPWHVDDVEQAVKVARNDVMSELTAEQRAAYERSRGPDREKLDKAIDEMVAQPARLRDALRVEAQKDGATDVEAYMIEKVQTELLPALAEANPGTKQHNMYLKYANQPEKALDDFGVLAKQAIPKAMEKFAAETIKPADLKPKRPTMEKAAAERRMKKDADALEAEYDKAVYGSPELKKQYTAFREGKVRSTPALQEVATREALPENRKKSDKLGEMRKEQAIARYKRQGILHARNNRKLQERVPVEVYDFDKKKWIGRQLNPMAAAVAMQKEIKFDPDATYDNMMRQIVGGLAAVLGSRQFEGKDNTSAIRLAQGGIDPELVVYKSKNAGDIKWKDVQKWAKTKDEKKGKQSDFDPDGIQAISGVEGLAMQEAQPLPAGESTTGEGGLAKDPGPYVPDVKRGEKEETTRRKISPKRDIERLRKLLEKTTDPKERKRLESSIASIKRRVIATKSDVSAARIRAEVGKKVREKANIKTYPPVETRGERLTKRVGPPRSPDMIIESARKTAAERKKKREEFEKANPPTPKKKEKAEVPSVDITKPLTREEMDMLLDAFREGKVKSSEVPSKDKKKVEDLIDADSSIRRNRHQRLVTRMAKQIGLSNIRVLETQEAVAIMIAAGQGDRITRRSGFTSSLKGQGPVIYVNPTLPEDAAIEVLGHELGHVVLNETWSKAPRKVKKAVHAEFEEYIARTGASPTIYEVIAQRTPQRLLEHMVWGNRDLDAPILSLSDKEQEYLLSFDEWFADNVAKWMVTDAKPRSLVQQFFKHVADMLRDLWSGLTQTVNTPEKSIQEYMDRVFQQEPEKNYAFNFDFGFSEVPAGASSIHGANWSVSGDEGAVRQAMSELLTGEEMNVLGLEVHRNHVRNQLMNFYGADPVAMSIIDESRTEEMIVLAYKAWRAGELKLRRKPESIFTKLMQKAAELLGIIMNDKNADALMRDIAKGAVGERVDGRKTYTQSRVNETNIQQARDVIERMSKPVLNWAVKIGGTAEMRVRWAKNASLTELWKQIYLSPDTAGGREGFFSAVRRTRAKFEREMHEIFEGEDGEFGNEVAKFLNKERPLSEANPKEREAVKQTYALLKRMYQFTVRAGVQQNYIGEDYFPRVYDMDALVKNRDEFIDMLVEKYPMDLQEYYRGLYQAKEGDAIPTKTNREIAEFIHRNLTIAQGEELSAVEQISREVDEDPLGWPAMNSVKERTLSWIQNVDVAPYMSQDIGLTLSTYIHQSAKRAEYNRRFGVGTGRKLVTKYLEDAADKGASEEDLAMAENAMKAALGTLGADINPTLHKWQGIIMVLENWMLLGLATLTSLVDPMGIAVRGDLETAWTSLNQGVKEAVAKMKGEQTDLSKTAGILGINELHTTVEALGYEYGGYYVTGAARKWNERLFSVNMLTQWTRVTRTMALAGARRFLAKHAAMDNAKSKRFMQELGVREGDVTIDEEGNAVIMDDIERGKASPEEKDRDERVRQALNRWVDEAILRPDAAQRPIWASDPHWMLVFHLKAFTYSFHERILRRVGHEIMQGNYQPVMMLMGYLPMMYAAEVLRNALQGDDDWEPDGFFETTHHLAQRSGLYGIGTFYFDAKDGWRYGDTPFSTLGGPSVEHVLSLGEAALTESDADDARVAVRSMPFHNLWKEWFE